MEPSNYHKAIASMAEEIFEETTPLGKAINSIIRRIEKVHLPPKEENKEEDQQEPGKEKSYEQHCMEIDEVSTLLRLIKNHDSQEHIWYVCEYKGKYIPTGVESLSPLDCVLGFVRSIGVYGKSQWVNYCRELLIKHGCSASYGSNQLTCICGKLYRLRRRPKT